MYCNVRTHINITFQNTYSKKMTQHPLKNKHLSSQFPFHCEQSPLHLPQAAWSLALLKQLIMKSKHYTNSSCFHTFKSIRLSAPTAPGPPSGPIGMQAQKLKILKCIKHSKSAGPNETNHVRKKLHTCMSQPPVESAPGARQNFCLEASVYNSHELLVSIDSSGT
jgi:hypothetical protein